MPVLLISTYNEGRHGGRDEHGLGRVCGSKMVALNIDEDHKTSQNIKERMAFTLSIADIPHIEARTSSASPAATRWRTNSSAAASTP